MALQFILGASGSGRTSYILEKIVNEAQQNLKKNYYVVVPEQFTMLTQRELVTIQKDHGIMNIDVVSFNRLAYRIFDELGKTNMAVLEETGKSLVLRKVAQDKLDELHVLKGNVTKVGYINELKSLISEMSQYKITPDNLADFLSKEQGNPAFTAKMQDVWTLYRGFRDYIEGTYVTAEEVLEVFCDVADYSALLQSAVLVFDCFTGFTPVQNQVLKRMMEIVEDIYVTVTLDPRENPLSYVDNQELFGMSKRTIRDLMRMAEETHFKVENPVWLTDETRDRFVNAPGLRHLQQNLFRSGYETMSGEGMEEICITSVSGPRMELRYVAQEIVRLVRQEGYRYKDIAVISGAVERYGNYVPEIFDACGISYFLDVTRDLLMHPFLEFIRSSLQVLAEDFSVSSVFRYLRCGFSGISEAEVDELENYVLATGVRGFTRWNRLFVKPVYGIEQEQLPALNEVRVRFLAPFLPLREAFQKKDATVRERTVAFYHFIVEQKLEQQLLQKQRMYEQKKEMTKAGEYRQIYRMVMDLMDKMVDLLGDTCMSEEEYAKILDAGFETMQVGVIPSGYDQVMIGDLERSRLDHVKILFIIGVNDGIVPKAENRNGIITQQEREELAHHHLELAPTARERIFMQRFYLYLAMSKPSERLYLSYTAVDEAGDTVRPSYLISMVQRLFPGMAVNHLSDDMLYQQFVTPENGFEFLLDGFQKKEEEFAEQEELWQTLAAWYHGDETYGKRFNQVIRAAGTYYQEEAIGKAVAKMLYGDGVTAGVTRLEQFAACACAHFLTYGLRLREREILSLRMADMGTIYHQALENYSRGLKERNLSWFDIQEEQQEELVQKAFDDAVAEIGSDALADTETTRYQAKRMLTVFRRTIWAITKQIRQGKFAPVGVEMSFAFTNELSAVNFALSEEEKMHLRGRIDRVDTYETEDKVYVKIVDYKSGTTRFELLSLYYGLQLQLVVYMNAAMELIQKKNPDKEVIPAGMFYYHIDDPIVEGDCEMSDEEIYGKILEQLKVEGVISTEEEAYHAMDTELSGKSSVIPLSLNKDGEIRDNDKAVDREQFALLSHYAEHVIQKNGQSMYQGDTAVRPYQLDKKSSCDYCPYRSVCGFDHRIDGFEMRELASLKGQAIFDKMKEAIDGDGEEMDPTTAAGH